MIVFDFIYFCIYSVVPDKAILGKRDGACTLFGIFTATLLLFLFGFCERIFQFEINGKLLTIVLFGGLFILTRMFFLRPAKFISMHRRFRKIPKWLLKTIGIIYLLLCFFVPMGLDLFFGKYLGM
ncbi:MAG: hypothetical protein LBH82_01170 [Bacteroidales bacterium]|nr:hypothetical protein [Bacteroidales bacterium]